MPVPAALAAKSIFFSLLVLGYKFYNAFLLDVSRMACPYHFAVLHQKHNGALPVCNQGEGHSGYFVARAQKHSGVQREGRHRAVVLRGEEYQGGRVEVVAAADVRQLGVGHLAQRASGGHECQHMVALVQVQRLQIAACAYRVGKFLGIIKLIFRPEKPVVGCRNGKHHHKGCQHRP